MDLSIIIVNYNGEKYLSDCLESIEKQCQGFSYEIIIWDNDSKDNSIEFLQDNYIDKIKLIASKDNLGFAGGNNAAAKYAKGKYLLLLNNDTILLKSPKIAIKLMEKESNVGVVGMKMLGSEKEYRYSAGRYPNPIRLLKLSLLFEKRGSFKTGRFKTKTPKTIDWIEGSFLLTKIDIWKKLKGLDERFFMYAEDIDYCKRVNNLGYLLKYIPISGYIHYGGYGDSRQHMLKKSLNLYVDIHINGISKILSKLALIINFKFKDAKRSFKKNS
ncbi:glycosyltransferase family 2 protein [Gaetbulibacter sp. NE]|uniref:glycosyltransferase family 2 protein n=1 Tax=Gaetbulibacter sp. NE TaxID=2982307 RepID=UPI0021D06160|nr:glycosyltransferase family 2 protein [Gaetbulibacter sp. NE]